MFYEIDEEGNLIDKDCKKIDPNDKDYESKRVVTTDIYGTMKKIEYLYSLNRFISEKDENGKKIELITGEAWDSKGNPINVIVGFKYTDRLWYGFSIDTNKNVMSFYDDINQHPFNKIDEEFKKQGIEITPGSFFTAKAENLRKKNKDRGNYDFWMDLTVTLYLSSGYGKKKKLIYIPSIRIKNWKSQKLIFGTTLYTEID